MEDDVMLQTVIHQIAAIFGSPGATLQQETQIAELIEKTIADRVITRIKSLTFREWLRR